MSSSNEFDPSVGDGEAPDNARRPLNPDLDDVVEKFLEVTARGEDVDVNQFVTAELPPHVDPSQRVELRRRLLASQSLMNLARAQEDLNGESDGSHFSKDLRNGDNHPVPRSIGRYEVVKVLAAGRNSIVYRAFDPKFDRDVALKVTRTGQALSEEHLERWRRDARAIAQFRHPNIVPLHEAGETSGGTYIEMELVQGTSLERMLQAAPGHRLDPAAAGRIARKMADALHYAHGQGVIHRDVKPSNILIDDKGEPQLIDFGLARRLSGEKTLTRSGQVLGTPAYLSPEQARGDSHTVTPRADVFSLGVVMYQMLTGQLPFDAVEGGEFELLGRIVNAAPTPPSRVATSIPRDLELICLKALEKEPQDRFTSAKEMADDLGRWLDDVPIHCRQVGRLERSRRWCRRNPVVASLAIGLIVALIAGIVGTSIYAHRARAREQESLFRLYVADIHLAQQYIQNNSVGAAVALLEKHRAGTDLDGYLGWEWHYLWRQCHPELRRFESMEGAVHSVAFSPSGRMVAAAGENGIVRLWQTATGMLLHDLRGPRGDLNQVAFDPNGQIIAAVGADHMVWVWNARTGERVAQLKGPTERLDSVVFSPDGRLLATGGQFEPSVHVWNTETWAPLNTLEAWHGSSLAIDCQSEHLAIGGADGVVRIVSLANGQVVQALRHLVDHRGGADAQVRAVAFSQDGTLLAAAGPGRRVTVWNTADWSEVRALNDSGADVLALSFDPHGRRLAVSGRDSVIRIWELSEPASRPHVIRGHASHVMSLAFSPDGWRLVSGSADGTVRLFNSYDEAEYYSLPTQRHNAQSVAFGPDGNMLATAEYFQSVSVWSGSVFSSHETLCIPRRRIYDVSFSPNGKDLAAVDDLGRLSLLDATTLDQRFRVKVSQAPSFAVAFAPNGKQIAVAGEDRVVRLIDSTDGRELFVANGHTGSVGALDIDTRGRFVASCASDGTVRIWNASNGGLERTIAAHRGEALCVALHPRRPLVVSGSNDQTIRLWDLTTGDEVHTFRGHAGTVWAVKFSPDGRRLFSGSSDGTVKVWDVDSGLELCTLSGHSHWVRDIDVHPDGWSIVSSGKDHKIRIWDAQPLDPADRVSREASGLVNFLSARFGTRDKTLAAIESDETIGDPVRRQAQDLAEQYPYHLAFIEEGHRAADEAAWSPAVDAFQQAVELAPSDIWHWHWLAMAQLGAQDHNGYARTREATLRDFGQHPTEVETHALLRMCIVSPPAAAMLDSLAPLVAEYSRLFPDDLWPAVLFHLRRGESAPVVFQELENEETLHLNEAAAYVLALALCRDARFVDARAAVALGDRRRLEAKIGWEFEVCREILRNEARDLLESLQFPPSRPALDSAAIPAGN